MRKKSGEFDQLEYIRRYNREHHKYKQVVFNVDKPDDVRLMEWIERQPEGISGYLKRLATEDREKREGEK